MNLSSQLASRFREVFLNGTWVANTNYKNQLSGLTWQQATKKVGSFNTIAALTFHINYYIAGVLNVFDDGALEIRDKYSFDTPPIESQKKWEELLNTLLKNAEKFANMVEQMPVKKLDQVFVDKKYGTYQKNIDGMIEHGYYHLGQISLIKKTILQANFDSY